MTAQVGGSNPSPANMKKYKYSKECPSCTGKKWTYYTEYFDFDGNRNMITFICFNCNHLETVPEYSLKGENNA